jgi:hypothetical protein
MKMREALWSAVAAATAFVPSPFHILPYEPKPESGRCCYHTQGAFGTAIITEAEPGEPLEEFANLDSGGQRPPLQIGVFMRTLFRSDSVVACFLSRT